MITVGRHFLCTMNGLPLFKSCGQHNVGLLYMCVDCHLYPWSAVTINSRWVVSINFRPSEQGLKWLLLAWDLDSNHYSRKEPQYQW